MGPQGGEDGSSCAHSRHGEPGITRVDADVRDEMLRAKEG